MKNSELTICRTWLNTPKSKVALWMKSQRMKGLQQGPQGNLGRALMVWGKESSIMFDVSLLMISNMVVEGSMTCAQSLWYLEFAMV